MLPLKAALRIVLLADSDLTAIIGQRLRLGFGDQRDTEPFLVYRVVDTADEQILNASKKGMAGLTAVDVRFFACAKGSTGGSVADALTEVLRLALQGYQDIVTDGGSPAETLFINGISRTNSFDLPFDDATQTHQVVSDFQVWAAQQRP